MVGDVDPQEVVATLTALFADAVAGPPPPDPPPEPARTEPVALFHGTNRDVADIVLGYPGAAVRDPNRAALEVLAEVLNARGGPVERGLATTPKIYRFGAAAATGSTPASWPSPSPAPRRASTPPSPRFGPRSPRLPPMASARPRWSAPPAASAGCGRWPCGRGRDR